jgi:hypothetical protein
MPRRSDDAERRQSPEARAAPHPATGECRRQLTSIKESEQYAAPLRIGEGFFFGGKMSQSLVRDAFTEEYWDEVQAFDCGSMPWELEVSDWLKGPIGTDSALTAIHNAEKPGRVWLYRLENGQLVGFGALG